MKAFRWKLGKIHIGQANLVETLNEWCLPEWMKVYFLTGVHYHNEQLEQFKKADQDTGKHWRAHVARQLFAVSRASIDAAIELDEFAKAAVPQHDPRYAHFWLVRNCRPYGGFWSADAQPSVGLNNPTGKPCKSILCPWCWMRRYDELRDIISKDAGTLVTRRIRGTKTKAIGLGREHLSVTAFDLYTNPTGPNTAEWATDPAAFAYQLQKMTLAFNKVHRYNRTEKILKCVAPLVNPDENWSIGFRFSIIHTGEVPVSEGSEGIWKNVSVDQAIKAAFPFPMQWWRPEMSCQAVLALLQAFRGRDLFNTAKAVQTPIPLSSSSSSSSLSSSVPSSLLTPGSEISPALALSRSAV